MTFLSYLHVKGKLYERFLSGKLCVHNLCNFVWFENNVEEKFHV